jgi:hypothetical protein
MVNKMSDNNIENSQYAYSTELTPTQQGFRITVKVRSNDVEVAINEPFLIWRRQIKKAHDMHMPLAPNMEPIEGDIE